eukprot:TRINITY_DN696_c0_g1_i4.p1 TRINITY_DN696_c0_g1~~TRINITY_DN696_c0_g1_i4.p1  ORF type:complete len:332 (+),score=43.74 TRINITY_DN696_c0_g1_i4:1-996(+)
MQKLARTAAVRGRRAWGSTMRLVAVGLIVMVVLCRCGSVAADEPRAQDAPGDGKGDGNRVEGAKGAEGAMGAEGAKGTEGAKGAEEIVVDDVDDFRPRRPVGGGGLRRSVRERERGRHLRERDSERMADEHRALVEEYGDRWREHRDEIREELRERMRDKYRRRQERRRQQQRMGREDDGSYAGAEDDLESDESDDEHGGRYGSRYEDRYRDRDAPRPPRPNIRSGAAARRRDRHDPHKGYYMFEARFVLRDAEANFEDTFDRANKWSERLDELTDAPCEVIPRNKEMLLVTVRDVTMGEHVMDLVSNFPDCTEVIFKTKFVPPIPKLRDI